MGAKLTAAFAQIFGEATALATAIEAAPTTGTDQVKIARIRALCDIMSRRSSEMRTTLETAIEAEAVDAAQGSIP